MKIAIVGTGYVGLVTGTCLADTGNNVVCVDIDKEKVEKLKNNILPIYEPDLDTIFERNVAEGRLEFTTDLKYAADKSDIIFLALPTPPGEDGSADLSYILKVADDLGKIISSYKVIINKSTVPVGTADKVREAISKNTDTEFDVVSNPEFLKEGLAVDDFMKPDRIVIGTKSEKARKILEELFAPFVRQGNPIIFMDERSSELTKYASNSYLATRITFMNEIANICERIGADVDLVRIGMGSDTRIGKRFLFPGIGYGGSCFPKDVSALHKSAKALDYNFDILDSVMRVNEIQKTIIVEKIKKYYDGNLKGKKFAIWGLAFKPDTDDIREAPALYIIDKLLREGASVSAYDPEAMENVKKLYGDKIELVSNNYDALKNADALIIATEWSVFRTPDFDKMSANLKEKVIFDGRNLYDLAHMEKLGYYYSGIGRRVVEAKK
ncbi:MAG TPA: UDP-glucose/GDP-mannose dehydrogenase family protein [Ignavibacteria bacterium]|nr:UDP-glucose 6-dehydrogenase [Bacteroidota bacterium]HRI84774.1 UDP-glucose/GDP-mannose dehydrogenase family protein [Ignavibacteria bacterium]HRJ98470.1 UDP-glucose/GDP-mannose dehydrogenase family protein [Ignavibacteria bacterium]